jgi:hypothetical protein
MNTTKLSKLKSLIRSLSYNKQEEGYFGLETNEDKDITNQIIKYLNKYNNIDFYLLIKHDNDFELFTKEEILFIAPPQVFHNLEIDTNILTNMIINTNLINNVNNLFPICFYKLKSFQVEQQSNIFEYLKS